MTADTASLQERLWEAVAEVRDQHPRVFNDAPTDDVIAAIFPVIAAEVRAAKAEALREMQEHHEREADKAQTITARGIHLTIADGARSRATEYETGDRA